MANYQIFASFLAKYYMEFLETDFKRQRLPKRRISGYHDNNNHLIGLNLNKYERFEDSIRSIIQKGEIHNKKISVKKGQYTTSLNKTATSLIKKQINTINQEGINAILDLICNEIISKVSTHKTNPFDGLYECEKNINHIIKENLIKPLINNIDEYLQTQTTQELESIFAIEENLTEILIEPISEDVESVFNSLLLNEEVDLKSRLGESFELESILSRINKYFDDISVDDLFFDLQRIDNNTNIKDKTSIYLYIANINYNKNKYPVFYIPVEIQKEKIKYTISFDSSLYINKKAMSFIVERINDESNKTGRIESINQRILYLNDYKKSEIIQEIQNIFDDIINHFELPETIPISSKIHQSKSLFVSASNSLHLYIADKSDEALINDYEELLEILKGDNPLSRFFNTLLENFITKNPESIAENVENEWDELPISEKLTPVCPIPMNSEQRKILQALNNNKGKYILVDGPPGTGKSHSITAIVFQKIFENKSVLVLSDKKEALDVVEEKITSVLNNVRVGDEFQNPILRLGKTGNSYAKVLSRSSINGLKQHYNAGKKHLKKWRKDNKNRTKELDKNIKALISNNKDIKIQDLYDYAHLESDYQKSEEYNLKELVLRYENNDMNFNKLLEAMFYLKNKYTDESLKLDKTIKRYIKKKNDYVRNIVFFEIIKKLKKTNKEFSSQINNLELFQVFDQTSLKELENFIRELRELKSGIFGLFMKGGKVKILNEILRDKTSYDSIIEPSDLFEKLISVYEILSDLNKTLRKIKILKDSNIDHLKISFKVLTKEKLFLDELNPQKFISSKNSIEKFISTNPINSELFDINGNSFESFWNNKLTQSESLGPAIQRHVELESKLSKCFLSIPDFDYKNSSDHIHELLTQKMTMTLDKRVIDFTEKSAATMRTLRSIIRKKQRFPKSEFEKLKKAFPCIICGIRDYADYIPLEPDIFDLIIIDEASQVSIAQALPALFRAKKVLVLGDPKQFSNVKSAQAKTYTNTTFIQNLEKTFKEHISNDSSHLARLEIFNIKSSILEFFEYVANCKIMLLKHFRGYLENISYSNKYFYNNKLQAIRIRTKPIDQVIKFTELEYDGKDEIHLNSNNIESQFILNEVNKLNQLTNPPSVGIISPFRNQVSLINSELSKQPNYDRLKKNLKIKVMTFDTCQGEERDYIFYSMAANSNRDKLSSIFLKSLEDVDLEEGGVIRAQRLNVGFSRSKECMHFVHSQPLEEFKGTIGWALRHYKDVLNNSKSLPDPSTTDQKSPMEKKLYQWIINTKFYADNAASIELKTQFPIGEYLKQLDPFYRHPNYKTDFLLIYTDGSDNSTNIVIEYDGFEHHFTDYENVNELNYEYFHNEDDVERQKILEGYGYTFIRLNKFNSANDPIKYLDEKLIYAVKKKTTQNKSRLEIINTVVKQQTGDEKKCPGCDKLRPISWFKSSELKSGFGTKCKSCVPNRNAKKINTSKRGVRTSPPSAFSRSAEGCPKCGADMVARNGRFGAFRGCTKYPYCNGTRRL